MVSEIDIYRSANQVINKCGKRFNPKEYSVSKMCSLYEKGDIESAESWARIGNAVEALLNDSPKKSPIELRKNLKKTLAVNDIHPIKFVN